MCASPSQACNVGPATHNRRPRHRARGRGGRGASSCTQRQCLGQGKHPRDQSTPLLASRVPHQSPSRKRRLSPPGGAGGVRRQHRPWCSRPAKVPVVRVLCRYKLGVRLGGCSSTSLQLTRLGGDCPPHPFSSLPQTSLGEGGSTWAGVPTCHPRGDRELVGCSAAHWGSLHDTATYPAAERDPAPSAAQQRPPPRALAGTPGPCAPRATRPAWHKGSMAQPRPAASASRRRPRDSSPGRCRRQPCPPPAPFPGQAGHRAEPCAPARSKQSGGGLRSLPLSAVT